MTHRQIKTKLKKYGITQGEAAVICGVGQPQLSLVLNGRHDSKRIIQKLASYLKALEQSLGGK
jgi:transcriptional regulator with XRE-family HTH domain